MKVFLLFLILIWSAPFGLAQETDLKTFMVEMSALSKFRKQIQREFRDWDGNDDGRLDHEDGAVGPEGLFLNEAIFKKVDESQSRSVSVIEYLEHSIREAFYALDTNRNGMLSTKEKKRIQRPEEFFRWLEDGALEFEVVGDTAYINGTIKSKVVKQFRQLFEKHPDVKTLVFGWVPGSADDGRLFEALELIRTRGVNTHAADHARIFSGGVDLFAVGKQRTMGQDVQFGVHSWASGRRREGSQLPKDHKEHKPYVDFYQSIEVPVEFYWFTLDAAVAEGMHIMSAEELERFRIISLQ